MIVLWAMLAGVLVFFGILWASSSVAPVDTADSPPARTTPGATPGGEGQPSGIDYEDDWVSGHQDPLWPMYSRLGGKPHPVMRRMLIQAGEYGKNMPLIYGTFMKLLVAFCAALLVTLGVYLQLEAYQVFLLGTVGAIVGLMVPGKILRRKINQRRLAMQEQLADVIDILVVRIEMGMRIDAACDQVVDLMRGPIPEEFNIMLQKMRAGMYSRDALQDMSDRVSHPGLTELISTLIQTNLPPTAMTKTLRLLSAKHRGRKHAPPAGDELKQALKKLKERVHRRLVDEMPEIIMIERDGEKKRALLRERITEFAQEEAERLEVTLPAQEKESLTQFLLDDLLGFGPIQMLLDENAVSGIMVNGPFQVYVEREGRLIPASVTFEDGEHVMRIIERMVAPLGGRLNQSVLHGSSRLPDGSFVQAVIPPLCRSGPTFAIAKRQGKPDGAAFAPIVKCPPAGGPPGKDKSMVASAQILDLVLMGTLSEEMATFLEACIKSRLNIVFAGGAESGKSTTLNVFACRIPEEERIIICENTSEMELAQPHVLQLITCPARDEGRKAVSLRDLFNISLALRPGRVIVGECRGDEVCDMLSAMRDGHDGLLTTCAADTPREALACLEALALAGSEKGQPREVRAQISGTIHLIVQLTRLSDGSRKITQVTEVQGLDGEEYRFQDLFRFTETGVDEKGKVVGVHQATGARPSFSGRWEKPGG